MKTLKLESSATLTTYTFSATVDNKKYTSAVTMRPDDYYMLVKMTGAAGIAEFEAKKLIGGYQIQLTSTEGAKKTIEGLAAVSMNESRTVNGKLYWNPTLLSEIKVSPVGQLY